MTMRALLLRGMLVGLVSAALALVFAWIFGEHQVSLAIAFEGHHAHETAAAEPEMVSRVVQQTSGLAVAIGLFGVAVGGLFAVAFALAYGRIGGFGVRATSALVAGGGFVTVALVPFLIYPANPPSVGVGDTIGARTGLYFAVIAISVAIVIASAQVGRRLAARLGNWNATLVAGALFVALVTVTYLVLPEVNEVPADFPAVLLWRFRLASLGTQVVLWSTLGLAFGALTERNLAARPGNDRATATANAG
ncbi:CbtA family protein [Streptosporangium amethystogenes]|uniref:CbtA family protein n=1 Tax=Streptosporangium amethystogenes TaxID=2002 RepID=UPI0004C47FBC|nr:CbtA family protein [Streptosporangium amethystogenes]